MSSRNNAIMEIVRQAIDRGVALEGQEVRSLRTRSKNIVARLKGVFWGGIVIVNLALWVPLPVAIDRYVLNGIALVALAVAIAVPFFGLKKHQMNLEMLKLTDRQPKKKTASAQGRIYIDQVKQQDRPFIVAEFELLEGGKWSSAAEQGD
jgi:hypothetical protein